MKTLETIMVDQDGNHVEAITLACPDCGGIEFIIFYPGEKIAHSHLLCVQCRGSFCDQSGDCAAGQLKPKDH